MLESFSFSPARRAVRRAVLVGQGSTASGAAWSSLRVVRPAAPSGSGYQAGSCPYRFCFSVRAVLFVQAAGCASALPLRSCATITGSAANNDAQQSTVLPFAWTTPSKSIGAESVREQTRRASRRSRIRVVGCSSPAEKNHRRVSVLRKSALLPVYAVRSTRGTFSSIFSAPTPLPVLRATICPILPLPAPPLPLQDPGPPPGPVDSFFVRASALFAFFLHFVSSPPPEPCELRSGGAKSLRHFVP